MNEKNPDREFFETLVTRLMVATDATAGPFANDLTYSALGLAGELGELRVAYALGAANVVEEAGDLLWYAARLARMQGLSASLLSYHYAHEVRNDYGSPFDLLVVSVGAACEQVKKSMRGSILYDGLLAASLSRVFLAIERIGGQVDADLTLIVETNIEKLRRRHPGGWGK